MMPKLPRSEAEPITPGGGLPPVLELVLEPRYERLQQLLQGVTQLIRSC
jgi:hypothetical protein